MINPITAITGLIKAGGGAVTGVAKVFKGSKAERDQQGHDKFMSTQQAFSSEFNNRNNRTSWDSLWDGLNRMPRPVMVILVLVYFMMSYFSQVEFQKINISLETVPGNMWYILGSIIAFYFGSRHFQKKHERMSMSKGDFAETQRRLAELDNKPTLELPEPVKKELPLWYLLARAEMDKNTKEVSGEKANPEVLKYHTATSLNAQSDEIAWCSAFVNWCVKTAGFENTNKANAQSWLSWGEVLQDPIEGCVVVFKRGKEPWQGHVGFFVSMDGEQVMCLGGNQGNEVNISGYRKDRVLGYRIM